jgi:hypothetical protein
MRGYMRVWKFLTEHKYGKYFGYVMPTPLPTQTYNSTYLQPFINESWNFGNQTPIIVSVYGNTFGASGNAIVQGSWLVTLIALYWLRHEDVMVPFFMLTLLTNIAFWTPGMIPEEWKWILVGLCIVLPLGAIVYSLITDR